MKYHYYSPWHVVPYRGLPPDNPELLYSGPCAIERLPDTLLLYIFDIDEKHSKITDIPGIKSTIESIVAVSQRWHSLATPILYRKIQIEIESDAKSLRLRRRLYDTLANNANLRSLTRDLTLHFCQNFRRVVEEDLEDIDQILQLLCWWRPHLQGVGITGDLARPIASQLVMQLSEELPLLRRLRLSPTTFSISLAYLFKHFDLSNLEQLSASDVGWDADPNLLVVRSPRSLLPEFEFEMSFLDELSPLTNLQTIILGGPNAPAGSLKPLLMSPRCLRSFVLHHIGWGNHINSYTTHAIQKLVDLQAGSLREISLGRFAAWKPSAVGTYKPQLLDVRHMPNLEELSLNASLVLDCQPAYLAEMISAPSLRFFEIEFDSEDQHCDPANLDEARQQWLVDFSVGRSQNTSSVPTGLEVHLNGHVEAHTSYSYDPGVGYGRWAWHDHVATKQELVKYGVNLSWTVPEYTQEEWQAKNMQAHEVHERESVRRKAGPHNDDHSREFEDQIHDAMQLRICRLFLSDTPSFCVH